MTCQRRGSSEVKSCWHCFDPVAIYFLFAWPEAWTLRDLVLVIYILQYLTRGLDFRSRVVTLGTYSILHRNSVFGQDTEIKSPKHFVYTPKMMTQFRPRLFTIRSPGLRYVVSFDHLYYARVTKRCECTVVKVDVRNYFFRPKFFLNAIELRRLRSRLFISNAGSNFVCHS